MCIRDSSDPGVLPVRLVNFSVASKGGKNELQWQTASETNSSVFEVERSEDGGNFSVIASVPAAGTSAVLRNYSYSDVSMLPEQAYYRLKQVDLDSSYYYSSIIVALQQGGSLRLYPNPATTALFVESAEEIKSIVVNDALGNAVTLAKKEGGDSYDTSALKPGIYFVLIQLNDKVLPHMIVIE